MVYVLLGLTSMFITSQEILKKKYNQKSDSGIYLFSAMIALFSMLFFVITNRNWVFTPILLLPALGFGVCYAVATVCGIFAIRCGSLAKTTLVLSFSLLIPTFYGMLVLRENIGPALIPGLLLLACSLFLTNYEKEETQQPISLRWVIFVSLAFVGNGTCTTVQKAAQVYIPADQQNQNGYMIMALGFVVVVMLLLSLCTAERKQMRETIRLGGLLAMPCGLMNGAVNYLVIYLNPRLDASILFPVLSGAGLIFVFLYSVLICHEKFNTRQYVGFGLGLLSVILLNL